MTWQNRQTLIFGTQLVGGLVSLALFLVSPSLGVLAALILLASVGSVQVAAGMALMTVIVLALLR